MHEGTVKALWQTYESERTRKDGGLSASFGYVQAVDECSCGSRTERAVRCARGDDLPAGVDRHIGGLAVRALLFEVSATPKPGLVDRENSGAHDDMDYAMFLHSANALRGCFERCAFLGMQEGLAPGIEQSGASAAPLDASGAFFRELRSAGLAGEQQMYRATGGVNTHKGLIFSLGILCAACGFSAVHDMAALRLPQLRRQKQNAGFDAVFLQVLCAQIAKGLLSGGEALPTHGQMVRQSTGLAGVKGEALSGFATAFRVGLPQLRRALAAGMHINEAMVYALLHLMTATEDSNVVYRGGRQGLAFVRERAGELLRAEPFLCERSLACEGNFSCGEQLSQEERSLRKTVDMEPVRRFDRQCISRHLSPGGSADLLAVSLMLHFVTDGYIPDRERHILSPARASIEKKERTMIKQRACAGTLESSDIFVEIEPAPEGSGLALDITSVVYTQFGEEIEKVIRKTLSELAVTDAAVRVSDRGAVDCTIRARVETAVRRGKGEE